MPTRLGPLPVEIIAPESDRYTAALVLVHGLWERARDWRRFAGYLAHRGWRCVAVDLEGPSDAAARLTALRGAIAALEAPPIVLGHDLGATLALQCADAARAVVAVAPLVGAPFGEPGAALQQAGTWLSRRRERPLRAPAGRWRAAYADAAVSEPAALVQGLIAAPPQLAALPGSVPAALFAAERDLLLETDRARSLAERLGLELHILPDAPRALLQAPGWERHVAAIHRWIVQRLGEDLLALYDEAWEGREKPDAE